MQSLVEIGEWGEKKGADLPIPTNTAFFIPTTKSRTWRLYGAAIQNRFYCGIYSNLFTIVEFHREWNFNVFSCRAFFHTLFGLWFRDSTRIEKWRTVGRYLTMMICSFKLVIWVLQKITFKWCKLNPFNWNILRMLTVPNEILKQDTLTL